MAAVAETRPLDPKKLEQFVFGAVDEVGAALNAALVVMGDKLGLYRAMAGSGPLSSEELASRTGTAERYVREWLNAQAAGGYVDYDPASGTYELPPEQTVALTDSDSPAYLPGIFQLALGSIVDSPRGRRSGARLKTSRAGLAMNCDKLYEFVGIVIKSTGRQRIRGDRRWPNGPRAPREAVNASHGRRGTSAN